MDRRIEADSMRWRESMLWFAVRSSGQGKCIESGRKPQPSGRQGVGSASSYGKQVALDFYEANDELVA